MTITVGRTGKNILRAVMCCVAFMAAFAGMPANADDALVVLLSNPRAVNGLTDAAIATKLAINAINAQGGLLGKQVKLEILNAGFDAAGSAQIARKAIVAKPMLVIGEQYSAAVLISSPLYAAAGIVQISPAATESVVTERKIPTLFRTIGRDDKQGEAACHFMARQWRASRIAFVQVVGKQTQELDLSVIDCLAHEGITPAAIIPMVPYVMDYSPVIDMIRKSGCDHIFIGAAGSSNIGRLVAQLNDKGVKAALFGSDPVGSQVFKEIAGAAAEGVTFTSSPVPSDTDKTILAINDAIRANGGDPTSYAYNAYAAVQAWGQAVQKSGSFTAAKVAEILHHSSFDTVLGRISFDSKGDIVGPAADWQVYVWRGENQVLWRP